MVTSLAAPAPAAGQNTGDGVGSGVAVSVGDAMSVTVGDAIAVSVGDAVSVGEAIGVSVGVGLTVGVLGGFMYFGVEQRLRDFVGFIPWVGFSDFTLAAIVVAILGPVLTLLPTLVLTRKYIKV